MLVVWDTASGIPIKSIFNPHPNGVIAMDISPDALFIVTLSAPAPAESDNNDPQIISLWEWTHPEREEALFTSVIDEPDVQKVRDTHEFKRWMLWSIFFTYQGGSSQGEGIRSTKSRPLYENFSSMIKSYRRAM